MRLFVAMDVPEQTRLDLGALIAKLRTTYHGARWSRTEGMHITLKFIGKVGEEKFPHIERALAAVRSNSPVHLLFHGTGFFPTDRHPRVFWAGIEASPNLAVLAAEMESRLEPLGIPREKRPFRPHLTLARFSSTADLDPLRDGLRPLGALEFGSADAAIFYLYQSTLKPSGAEYTRLAKFDFVESA